jgi:hypothetical protein
MDSFALVRREKTQLEALKTNEVLNFLQEIRLK